MKAYLKPKTINKINTVGTLANKTFSNFVTGQCLEALIFGSLVFVGMLIFRFPYASTIGVLLGFTALIPIFGAFIGTAVGFILIMMVSPVKAILFVVFIIVLQQIEGNLIYPRVVGKSIDFLVCGFFYRLLLAVVLVEYLVCLLLHHYVLYYMLYLLRW